MYWEAVLVSPRVIRVQPGSPHCRHLLEHPDLELLRKPTEIAGTTQPCRSSSNDGHLHDAMSKHGHRSKVIKRETTYAHTVVNAHRLNQVSEFLFFTKFTTCTNQLTGAIVKVMLYNCLHTLNGVITIRPLRGCTSLTLWVKGCPCAFS